MYTTGKAFMSVGEFMFYCFILFLKQNRVNWLNQQVKPLLHKRYVTCCLLSYCVGQDFEITVGPFTASSLVSKGSFEGIILLKRLRLNAAKIATALPSLGCMLPALKYFIVSKPVSTLMATMVQSLQFSSPDFMVVSF
jgi:hypothetical protein